MDSVAASIAVVMVKKAGGEAARLLAQRAKLWLMKKGLTGDSDPLDRTQEYVGTKIVPYSALSTLNMLPKGVTYRSIKQIIDSPGFISCTQQLIAAHLVNATPSQRNRAIDALRKQFREEFPRADQAALAKYFSQFSSLLDAAAAEIAANLVHKPRDTSRRTEWANAVLLTATVDSIAVQLESQKRTEDVSLAQQQAWLDGYMLEFVATHRKIRPPDLTTRRLVNASRLFVSPRLSFKFKRGATYLQFDDLMRLVDRTVILGDPGAGKSTASEQFAVRWSECNGPVFYIRMKEVRFGSSGFDLVGEVERICASRYQQRPPKGVIERLLLTGNTLIAFDALDEVATMAERRLAVQVVEAASRRFPLARFLVTAREIGYSAVQLDQEVFTAYTLVPFDREEFEQYAKNWFALATAEGHDLGPRSSVFEFLAESESIPDLRSNPLMLSFICVLYRGYGYIPRNRTSMYQKCVDLLLRGWDRMNRVAQSQELGDPQIDEPDMYMVALSRIARLIYSEARYARGLTEQQLKDCVSSSLTSEAVSDKRAALTTAASLVRLCRGRAWLFTDMGLNESGEELYSFTHPSFLEYFAAQDLVRSSSTPENLADKLLATAASRQNEVLVQMCLSLSVHKTPLGSSRAFVRLVEQAPENLRDRSYLMELLTKAADVVMLNESAVEALVRKDAEVFSQQPSDLTAKYLMRASFRHASVVPAMLTSVMRDWWRNSPELLEQALANADWAWDFCLQHEVIALADLHRLTGGRVSRTWLNMFNGAFSRLSNRPPINSAEWLIRNLSGESGCTGSTRATRALWDLSQCLGDLTGVPELHIHTINASMVDMTSDTVEFVDRAIAKSVGRGPASTGALVLICLGLADVAAEWIPRARIDVSQTLSGLIEVISTRS